MPDSPLRLRYYTPGFHSDVIWLEDQRDYAVVLMGCMAQNLQACRVDPAFGVFLHELTYLKPYLDANPLEREYVRDLIRQGRVGTGGAHSLPTTNLISGEAFLRNFAYGRAYHENLGDRPEVAMLWDLFGHCSQLPQMLEQMRFRGLIWSKEMRHLPPLFWHLGLDGTKFLTRRVMYGYADTPRERAEDYLRACLPEIAALGHPVDLRLNCNDFEPPTGWIIGRSAELAGPPPPGAGCLGTPDVPWLISGQAHQLYFREMHEAIGRQQFFVPTTGRDLEYYHEGTGLAHIDLKLANRLVENTLISAEKWCSFAEAVGAAYPHVALDKAWRQLFFGQHHDAITGPCCDRAYLDLMDGYREAWDLARAADSYGRQVLAAATNTRRAGQPDAVALVVSNPCNWDRTDVVETAVALPEGWTGFEIRDTADQAVPCELVARQEGEVTVRFAATVPGLGQSTYWAVAAAAMPAEPQARAGRGVETNFFRITADGKHGGLVSLFDKRLGQELLSGAGFGNELVALAENFDHHPEPPWELNTIGGEVWGREFKATLEVREGPVSVTLVSSGKFKDCRREQHVILYHGVPRIEFRTVLRDYQGREDLLAVTFPAALPGAAPVFDDRFGCVVKRQSRGKLDFRTWQWRNYSDCGLGRAGQWVDLSSSARLLFGEGDEVVGSRAFAALSLVFNRAQGGEEAFDSLQEAFVSRGVTCTLFPDDCDRDSRWQFPHQDSTMPSESPDEDLPWGTAFRVIADVADTNLLWQRLRGDLTPQQAEALGERRCREGHVVIFLRDAHIPEGWPPLPTIVVTAASAAKLRKALDGLAKELAATGDLCLPAEADLSGEAALLPDHGLALLNRGIPLHSLENDGTLALLLMHCIPWARTVWGPDRLDFHLIAERKTHVFEYALYPHAGTWREGGTPQAGYDYNNPLVATQTTLHAGPLPATGSFCEVEGGIVTALKPSGYAIPTGRKPAPPDRRPYLLRVYEPGGQAGKLQVKWRGGLQGAERANALEEPQAALPVKAGRLTTPVRGFEIGSYLLTPATAAKPTAQPTEVIAPPEREPGVIPARYWLHNLGEAPLGYVPVGLTLKGDIQTNTNVMHGGFTVNTLTVGVANNLPRAIKGKVRLVVAEGWRTLPEEVAFDVPARGGAEYPVTLVFDDRRRAGLVRAQLEWDGQVYEDTVVAGEAPAPQWQARATKKGVRVTVTNPGADDLHADLYLIGPHETWEGLPGGDARPRHVPLRLAPGAEQRLEFPPPAAGWLVAKLAYWGRVEYQPIRLG